MKKLLFIFALLILNLCCIATANAENFYIKNYDVDINVDKYKSANIREDIQTYFTNSSHGIYRNIPIKKNDKITNIKVNEQHSISISRNNAYIKIGNPDRYIRGDKKYTISYNYHIRDDKDEFYFNIIGTEWNTDIEKVRFKITMPDTINPDNVGLSIGEYGTRGFKNIAGYSVNGNVITGETIENLPPNNGVTIRVEVPSGYFKHYEKTFWEQFNWLITLVVMLISVGTAILIWFIYGKDKHITPIVTFYPPKNLNSAQVGVIYREKATISEVLSLIHYLASKGYIKIIDDSKGFKLEKLKDYDGTNNVEASLMETLFSTKDVVTENSLRKSRTFYSKMENITKKLSEFRKEIFTLESLSFKKKVAIALCILATLFLIFFAISDFTLNFLSNPETLFLSIFVIVGILVLSSVFPKSPLAVKLFITFWAMGFAGIPLLMILFTIPSVEAMGIVALGIVSIIIECVCLANLPQWTEEARHTKGEILGFRQFLKVAEEDRIRQLLRDDPNYCYDLLPYAYILGVAPEFMKAIEKLMVPAPDWYTGAFTYASFHHISQNLYSSSIPSYENGGIKSSSSGGGGFSGGGHGGGGGGSW